MTHGTTDWGNIRRADTLYTTDDIAELAVRLGSPVTIDRRGNVICFDTFSRVTYETPNFYGPLYPFWYRDFNHVIYGDSSLHLVIPADPTYARCSVYRDFPLITTYNIGVAWSLFLNEFPNPVEFWGTYYTGTHALDFGIRYYPTTGVLQYYDAVTGWTNFGTLFYNLSSNTVEPMFIKLVINPVTGYYVRFIIANQEFDLSTKKYLTPVGAQLQPMIRSTLTLYPNPGSIVHCSLDCLIVSTNEP